MSIVDIHVVSFQILVALDGLDLIYDGGLNFFNIFFACLYMTLTSLVTYQIRTPTNRPTRGTSIPERRQGGRAITWYAGNRGSIPGRDRLKSLKQVVTAPLRNAWGIRLARVHSRRGTLKNLHCSMAMSAEHRSKLHHFTGNGYVSIWVKNSRVGRKKNQCQRNERQLWTSQTDDCDVKLAKACVVFWLHHQCLSIRCGSKTCFSPSENFLKYTELQRLRKLQRCIAIRLRG